MGIDIRLPNITASTEREQLLQMKSYLFQLAEQLQWALQNVDTSNNTVVVAPTAKSLGSAAQTPTSAEASFGALKALIIKSADIVNAYSEEISKKLVGGYEAYSDFGDYVSQTEANMLATSTNIKLAFENVQTISTNLDTLDSSIDYKIDSKVDSKVGEVDSKVEEVRDNLASDISTIKDGLISLDETVVKVSANIKAGMLYENNGTSVFGFEVGQTNMVDGVEVFKKFARFTADRLAFYDKNGVEVAYMSDSKLYIYDTEITSTLKIGGYLVDTKNGLSFKWVGGS